LFSHLSHMPQAAHIETPNCISRYIVASSDQDVRHRGASGGVVSEIIRYLLSAGIVQTAINYRFDKNELFVPELIFSYDEYHQVGSIYHDIPIAGYLRTNILEIKGALVVVCLPCQVAGVRHLLSKNNISHFIISLFCSGQQKKEATWLYLKNKGVHRKNIEYLSYRGEGWPSGIRIVLKNNKQIFDPNLGGDWGKYRIPPFCLQRCMYCRDTFGINADITVGDPWLKKYMETEKIGLSLVGTMTPKGDEIMTEMIHKGLLHLIEKVSDTIFVNSQASAIIEKYIKRNTRLWQRLFYRTCASQFYSRLVLNKNMNLHAIIYKRFKRLVYILLRIKLMFIGAAR